MSDIELEISGMTCASCANRIERKLNKLDGVVATVNYATEKAKVTFPDTIATEDLVCDRGAGRLQRARAERGGRPGSRCRRPDAVARQRLLDLDRADRARGRDGDDHAAPGHQLAVALAHAGRAGRGVGRLAVPPCRLGQPPPRHLDDGHPDLARHAGGAGLVGLRAVLGHGRGAGHDPPVRAHRRTHRRRRQHLPRGGRGGHDVHPGRALLRGAVEAAGRRGPAGPARAGRQGRRGAPRRSGRPGRGAHPDRPARGGHAIRGPPRREDRDRRRHRGGRLGRRRLDAHRRVGARRGRSRRRRRRRHRQRRRPARRPRHPGRQRHPARPDGPAGRGRPERQGPGAAPGRPDLRHLRPDRDRPRRRHAGVLARHRRRLGGGVHRRRRGADHRLPLRARPGDADGADGRHRSRRAARHPDQGARGARVDPPGRHRRARQDRHRHDRPDDPGRRGRGRRARTPTTCSAWPARWRTPPSTPSPRRSRPAPAPGSASLPAVEDFANLEGLGVQGIVAGHAVLVGRPRLLADWSQHLPPELDARPSRRAGDRRHRRRRRLGRRGPRHRRRRRRGQAHVGRGDRCAARARACARCC